MDWNNIKNSKKMSNESKNINSGRVVYITPEFSDPNNYTDRLNGGYGTDNITYNPEEYCTSVDLQVIVPDRQSCGGYDFSNVKNKTYEFTLSSDKNYTSFMSGRNFTDNNGKTSKFLSTSYTNSVYSNLNNDNDNKENLGIESIDIDFNHYMYPIVTIKFIDIRGYTLMMPEEKQFTERISNAEKKAQSFFSALFRFPYPIFLLKVKGFYGDAVTFQLAVNDFKSSFDSTSGNFIITVSFIGYMYGLYADIPMKYLLAAPYDEYAGAEYWNHQNFMFDDNTKIPKFIEFLRNIANANDKIEQITNRNPNVIKYKQYKQQISALNDILSKYKVFVNSLGGGIDGRINGDKYILILGYTNNNGEILGIYDTNAFKAFYESVESYNNNGWDRIEIPNNDKIGTKYFMDEVFSVQNIPNEDGSNSPGIIFLYRNNGNLKEWCDKISQDYILNELIGLNNSKYEYKNIKKLSNRYGYLYEENDFAKSIESKINDLTEKQKKLNEYISNEITKNATEVIGFKPTIRNVYKMIFAYLDTFLNSYYTCLNQIKTDNRSFKSLGINISQSDVKTNIGNNVFVPPFPLITLKENNSEVWPGELSKGNSMPEVSLVNGILNGIIRSVTSANSINSFLTKDNDNNDNVTIPINLTDLFMPHNPYVYAYSTQGSQLKVDEMMSYFGLRAINFLSFQNIDNNDTLFGECEAYNYYNSHPIYDDNVMKLLVSPECNGDLLIKILRNENNQYSINGEQFYSLKGRNHNKEIIKDGKYNWIVNKKEYFIPVNFKTFKNIESVLNSASDSYYSKEFEQMFLRTYYPRDNENKSDIINNNIFSILENSYEDFIKIKENVLNKDLAYIKDKNKIFDKWFINEADYSKLFKTNNTISLKEKGAKISTTKHSNFLFKDRNYDNSVVLYNINPIKFNNFFDFNGEAESITTQILSKQKNISNFFLPTLQFNNDSSLYGSSFFYLQNCNVVDDKIKLYRKAFLFLHSLPYSKKAVSTMMAKFNKNNNSSSIELLPEGFLLFIGAILWRKKYCNDNNISDFINYGNEFIGANCDELLINQNENNDLSLNVGMRNENVKYVKIKEYFSFNNFESLFDLRDEVKNTLINNFEDWVNDVNGFKLINNNLELKLNGKIEITPDKLSIIKDCWSLFNNNYNTITDRKKSVLYENIKKLLSLNEISVNIVTMYDFLSYIFDNNVYNVYQKIGCSEEVAIPSFLLMHSKDEIIINKISNIFIKPKIVFLSRFISNNIIKNGLAINETSLKNNFEVFRDVLKKLYNVNDQSEINNKQSAQVSSNLDDDIRNSAYLCLKNLYDRWLCSTTNERWRIKNENNYYKDFCIVDSHYNDIGDKLIVDCDMLFKLFKSIIENPSSDNNGINYSVFEVMSSIAEKSNCLLLALPVSNAFNKPERLYNMFTPYPYNNTSISGYEMGTSFICMHTFVPSTHLDIEDETNGYKNDGIDIANVLTSNNESIPEDMLRNGKYSIPCFGVTFGKQNQNFFKRIDVNMDNPAVTEESIANTLLLGQSAEKGTNNKIVFKGQNLYDIYANRSYTCTVEMMGCAPIMPLLYFQLNNIPMFRGAYIIIKVKHHIEAGNMTTTFTGVRVNRNNLPINKDVFTLLSLENRLNNVNDENVIATTNDNVLFTPDFYNPSFKNEYIIPKTIDDNLVSNCEQPYCYDEVSKLTDKNGLPLIIFSIGDLNQSGGAKKTFDDLELNMRKLIVDIAKAVDYNTNYKLLITSLKRYNYGSNSDHVKGFAADIHGCEVDNSGKVISKKKYSADLFDLIATTFTPYIKQLIWENKKNDVSYYRLNNVDNCIHLSSYGYGPTENVQIFQSSGDDWGSIPILNSDDFYPLSESFLSTCAFLVSKGLITMNNINNFVKSKMTSDEYKEKLLKFNVNRG